MLQEFTLVGKFVSLEMFNCLTVTNRAVMTQARLSSAGFGKTGQFGKSTKCLPISAMFLSGQKISDHTTHRQLGNFSTTFAEVSGDFWPLRDRQIVGRNFR